MEFHSVHDDRRAYVAAHFAGVATKVLAETDRVMDAERVAQYAATQFARAEGLAVVFVDDSIRSDAPTPSSSHSWVTVHRRGEKTVYGFYASVSDPPALDPFRQALLRVFNSPAGVPF